jgi:hypothetical protein
MYNITLDPFYQNRPYVTEGSEAVKTQRVSLTNPYVNTPGNKLMPSIFAIFNDIL